VRCGIDRRNNNCDIGQMPTLATEFYGSLVLALLTVVPGLWLANATEPWLRSTFEAREIQAWARSPIFDPLAVHMVAYVTVVWMLFVIVRYRKWRRITALLFALIMPLLVLGLTAAATALVIKPALAIPRPPSFSPANEPPLISFMHERIGHGLGFPSGNTVRQVILCAGAFTLLHHPAVTAAISKQTAALLQCLNVLLLVSVMFVREVVGSHSLFDSVGGLAFGIMMFWAVVIPFNALTAGASGFRFAKHFSVIWLVFALGILFYSRNPYRWAVTALVIYLVLAGEVLILSWVWKSGEEIS
jgi:hypothetical protein